MRIKSNISTKTLDKTLIKLTTIINFVRPMAIRLSPLNPREILNIEPKAKIIRGSAASLYFGPKRKFKEISGNITSIKKVGIVLKNTHFVKI